MIAATAALIQPVGKVRGYGRGGGNWQPKALERTLRGAASGHALGNEIRYSNAIGPQSIRNQPMIKPSILPLAATLLALSAGTAPAATPYDGVWNILVKTQTGSCDPTYRLPVKIENGAMRYVGDRPFQ